MTGTGSQPATGTPRDGDRPALKVLVVDDDSLVARVHRGFVEKTPGFAVVGEAHDGATALSAAGELRPDLMLLDIGLPDMSGLDVLRRISAESDTDVLMVSATEDPSAVRQAAAAGAVGYLRKPFAANTLTQWLRQYAETQRLRPPPPGPPGGAGHAYRRYGR